MNKLIPMAIALYLAAAFPQALRAGAPEISSGEQSHADLVELYRKFEDWRNPSIGRFQDYGPASIRQRQAFMRNLQARLDDMNAADWDVPQQVDYLAVRSRLDQEAFRLLVSKPWSRDPGFYIDRILRLAFIDLPVPADELESVRERLAAVPLLVGQAMENLDEVAADYADLALHNLSSPDGVGHGHPYRAEPPAGVLGWYDDLLGRASRQEELRREIQAARDAVARFNDWLKEHRPEMTAQAGVGREYFDWYLKHVKLMPYTVNDILALGKRELDRLWSVYALEQHRNRNLPPLELSASAAEYEQKLQLTDAHVRDFLVGQEILTIPDYVGELDTNAPWIVRSDGPNFWEQVQFRDPHPDHLHAVIPGHRFDRLLAQNIDHPIRGRIFSGARAEGWGVYVEEGMLNAGIFDELPRVRELIYIFGIFRAARVPADVWLQLNEMTVSEVTDYWMERVPYMNRDVARVDAEIYLRRPPGYGLGYTVGMLQMQGLLADRKRQLGDAFVLKDFHDEFLGKGWLPISLIRWEMTGLDDEVRHFWKRDPLPEP